MRFDVNCVLGRWPEGGATFVAADDLLPAMQRLRIDRALVRESAGSYYDAQFSNQALQSLLAGHENLVPCWTILPTTTGEHGSDEEQVATLARNGVRAVCFYPAAHGYRFSAWQCGAMLSLLAERRYVALLDFGQTDFDQIYWLCSTYPELRVVLLTTRYRVLRPLFGLMAECPNVFLELSSLANFRGIEALHARFGPERLLFGSGQPQWEGAGIATILAYSDLPAESLEAINGGNLQRLLDGVQL